MQEFFQTIQRFSEKSEVDRKVYERGVRASNNRGSDRADLLPRPINVLQYTDWHSCNGAWIHKAKCRSIKLVSGGSLQVFLDNSGHTVLCSVYNQLSCIEEARSDLIKLFRPDLDPIGTVSSDRRCQCYRILRLCSNDATDPGFCINLLLLVAIFRLQPVSILFVPHSELLSQRRATREGNSCNIDQLIVSSHRASLH